jgi:hypothetical protein
VAAIRVLSMNVTLVAAMPPMVTVVDGVNPEPCRLIVFPPLSGPDVGLTRVMDGPVWPLTDPGGMAMTMENRIATQAIKIFTLRSLGVPCIFPPDSLPLVRPQRFLIGFCVDSDFRNYEIS